MTFVNIPRGDDALYINEQKSEIQNDISAAVNQTGGVRNSASVPTAQEICQYALFTVPTGGSWQMPNLSGVLPSDASTIVIIKNNDASTGLSLTGASGVTIDPPTGTSSVGKGGEVRTYLAIQSGANTTYYNVATRA